MKLIKEREFSWYLDITSDKRYSVCGYPFLDRSGMPLCSKCAEYLLLYERVIPDSEADDAIAAYYCWMCDRYGE